MTKKVLPPCSKSGCHDAADIVLNGALLCAQHAAEALGQRNMTRTGASKE